MSRSDLGPGLKGPVYRTSLFFSPTPPLEVVEDAIEAREGLPPGSVRVRIVDPMRDVLHGVRISHREPCGPHNTCKRDPGRESP